MVSQQSLEVTASRPIQAYFPMQVIAWQHSRYLVNCTATFSANNAIPCPPGRETDHELCSVTQRALEVDARDVVVEFLAKQNELGFDYLSRKSYRLAITNFSSKKDLKNVIRYSLSVRVTVEIAGPANSSSPADNACQKHASRWIAASLCSSLRILTRHCLLLSTGVK